MLGKKDPLRRNSKTRMAGVGIEKRDAEIGYCFEGMAEGIEKGHAAAWINFKTELRDYVSISSNRGNPGMTMTEF